MSEEEMLAKLEKSREQAKQGKYRIAEEMVSDMREKYDLVDDFEITKISLSSVAESLRLCDIFHELQDFEVKMS